MIANKDGGDLGRANFRTEVEQIPYTIRIVSKILVDFATLKPQDKILAYCIEFDSTFKGTVECMLKDTEEDLPSGVSFYMTDKQRIFSMRSASGGVVTSSCFYLILK